MQIAVCADACLPELYISMIALGDVRLKCTRAASGTLNRHTMKSQLQRAKRLCKGLMVHPLELCKGKHSNLEVIDSLWHSVGLRSILQACELWNPILGEIMCPQHRFTNACQHGLALY
jgi:hypothetical protein